MTPIFENMLIFAALHSCETNPQEIREEKAKRIALLNQYIPHGLTPHPVYRRILADLKNGEIYSIQKKQLKKIKGDTTSGGYMVINVSDGKGTQIRTYAHRIIVECAIGCILPGNYDIHHCDYLQYSRDSIFNLRIKDRKTNRGYSHSGTRAPKAKGPFDLIKNDCIIGTYPTLKAISDYLEISYSAVKNHFAGRQKTVGGCVIRKHI